MVARRTFLVGVVGAFTAGCVDVDGSGGDGSDGAEVPTDGSDDATVDAETSDPHGVEEPDAAPGYFFTAAPVEANDGLEPVLSTDDEAVAAIEPLVDEVVEVTEIFEVTHRSVTADEAEAFGELTADVERYFTGNPPGYYVGHEGRRVSVTLGGG